MLLVADIKKDRRHAMTQAQEALFGIDKLNVPRSEVPAITHVDYSARLQTVHKDTNEIYYRLIKRFHEITGCPRVVTTSFNVRGEPLVCAPSDAFRCFMGTDLDGLVVGNLLMLKPDQDSALRLTYEDKYELIRLIFFNSTIFVVLLLGLEVSAGLGRLTLGKAYLFPEINLVLEEFDQTTLRLPIMTVPR